MMLRLPTIAFAGIVLPLLFAAAPPAAAGGHGGGHGGGGHAAAAGAHSGGAPVHARASTTTRGASTGVLTATHGRGSSPIIGTAIPRPPGLAPLTTPLLVPIGGSALLWPLYYGGGFGLNSLMYQPYLNQPPFYPPIAGGGAYYSPPLVPLAPPYDPATDPYWTDPGTSGSDAATAGGTSSSGSGDSQATIGSLRLQVEPTTAQVFVDNFYLGMVEDFNGPVPRLNLEPGPHHIEIRADDYDSLAFDVKIEANRTITYRGELQRAQP